MRVYTDAARDGDVAAFAWKIVLDDGIIEGNRYILEDCTSMEAEYYALLDGLRHAKQHGDEVELFTDCQPLVDKMRVPDGNSDDWYKRRQGCHRLLNKFDEWQLEWTPRSSNSRADRLAYEALERGRQE